MKGEKLIGRLATGIGMGTTFTQLDWAKRQFIDRVGVDPFPGTINVIVDGPGFDAGMGAPEADRRYPHG